jgi:hypothetical protein
MQGFLIQSYCYNGPQYARPLENWELEEGAVHGSSSSKKCATSTLLVFHQPQHPVLSCVLQRYREKSFVDCLSGSGNDGGVHCLKRAYQGCFDQLKLVNGLQTDGTESTMAPSIVHDYDGDAVAAATMLMHTSNWTVAESARMVWLGELTRNGKWKDYPIKSLLRAVQETIQLKDTNKQMISLRDKASSSSSNPTQCSKFSTNLFVDNSYMTANTHTGVEYSRCSPAIVVVGFQHDYHHRIAEMLLSHPLVLPPLHSYYSFESPSFHMSSSPCYHHQHPSTGSNSNHDNNNVIVTTYLQRSWCVPFVSASEPFRVLDASSAYGTSLDAPRLLQSDNFRNDKKIIFVISNPVSRWERHCVDVLSKLSQSTFSHGTTANASAMYTLGNSSTSLTCNDVAELGMSQISSFSRLRVLLSNTTANTQQELLTSFYHHVNKQPFTSAAASASVSSLPHSDNVNKRGVKALSLFDSIFVESLSVFGLWYYQSLFGASNLLVVNEDDFQNSQVVPTDGSERYQNGVKQLFQFVGLGSADINVDPTTTRYRSASSLPSSNVNRYNSLALSAGTKRRLIRYFAPFVTTLEIASGLNLTSWLPQTIDLDHNHDKSGLWKQRLSSSGAASGNNNNNMFFDANDPFLHEFQNMKSSSNNNNNDKNSTDADPANGGTEQVELLMKSSEAIDDFETWFDVLDSHKKDASEDAKFHFNFVGNLLPVK